VLQQGLRVASRPWRCPLSPDNPDNPELLPRFFCRWQTGKFDLFYVRAESVSDGSVLKRSE